MALKSMPPAKEQEYYNLISKIESNDNPRAKNPLSSASGRFQFIKSTWTGLGYRWEDVFNDSLQWEAIRKLTAQNEAALLKGGCAINFATLYGAHFLGPNGLLKVMRGSPQASITTVTSAAQRKANPTILKGTVKDFCDWLERKTGDSVYKRYTNEGGPGVVVPPAEEPKRGSLGAIVFIILLIIVIGVVTFLNMRG